MTERPDHEGDVGRANVASTFGEVAGAYAAARPGYPPRLFDWLAREAPGSTLAWDCACGSGQASVALAGHFARVVGTDASADQIAAARPNPRVEYRVAAAQHSGLPDRSVDLITVAQALHWLPLLEFYAEARRVARPGALIAAWTYHWLTTGDERIDATIAALATGTLAGYWPAGREHVDNEYADLDFPTPRLPVPAFELTQRWDADRLLTYLRSWSAVSRFRTQHGTDPVAAVEPELRARWAELAAQTDPADDVSPKPPTLLVRWPLTVLAARLP